MGATSDDADTLWRNVTRSACSISPQREAMRRGLSHFRIELPLTAARATSHNTRYAAVAQIPMSTSGLRIASRCAKLKIYFFTFLNGAGIFRKDF